MIVNFIMNYYIVLLAITIFLVLALIGYIMDMKLNANKEGKISKKDIKNLGSVTFENMDIDKNIGLSEMINNNRSTHNDNQSSAQ